MHLAKFRYGARAPENVSIVHQPRRRPKTSCKVWLSNVAAVKATFRYTILVADTFEAGRKQVRSWSQTCSELEFGLSSSSLAASEHNLAGLRPATNMSATSFELVSDQDSVMEFGFNEAKTPSELKFAGVPQTNEPISAASGPKFTIL